MNASIDEALEQMADCGAEFAGGLSNHGPMVVKPGVTGATNGIFRRRAVYRFYNMLAQGCANLTARRVKSGFASPGRRAK